MSATQTKVETVTMEDKDFTRRCVFPSKGELLLMILCKTPSKIQ